MLPEAAKTDGRADESYLMGWTDGVPDTSLPTQWEDASGRMMEWRLVDGKPGWVQYDGRKSARVRRTDANLFTGFRCAR